MSRESNQGTDAVERNLDEASELLDGADALERTAAELERRARELERRLDRGADRQPELAADITIVLDRSGSMGSIRDEAIESFNGFLAEQRTLEGEASVSLVQFDHEYEPNFEGVPLPDVPYLSPREYRPRGRTALLDAIGQSIVRTEARLDRFRHQPELIVFVILTDGYENASCEYTRQNIFDMIRGRETRCGWRFIFLGANQDAIREGGGMGIRFDHAMTVGSSKEEYLAANRAAARKVRLYRSSGQTCDLAFTPQERREAKSDRGA
jgi:hypothetical protein